MAGRSLKALVQGGVFVALAILLEYITLFIPAMPQGGKFISLGMVPLIAYALLQGWKWGVPAAMAFGTLYAALIDRSIVHPLQFFLDYIFAFGMIGLAGVFSIEEGSEQIFAAILIACFFRFLVHFFSGIIFIDIIKPGIPNPWLYSLVYNAVYMLPTTLICWLLVPPIIKHLRFLSGRR